MPAQTIRFGRFELQPQERRLLVDGAPATLGARGFDLLVALAERAGHLVTKQQLLDIVWAGVVVEEANLTVQVSGLRKLLGGDVIATIPGRGYRFTEPVENAAGGEAAGFARAMPPAAGANVPEAGPEPRPGPAPALPTVPALIGRDAELAEIAGTLALAPCVTLIGLAGVGKTSLARGVAARWAAGAVWVDLAALTDAAQVALALAHALDRPPADDDGGALARALGDRLLVLDNAEHLLDATAALATTLLAARPELHLLVTSQAPLSLVHERVRRIQPLALPLDSDALDLQHGAIALFVERARAADHRFRAEPAAMPLLRRICRRLDGLPLALEMAAVRVPALGLHGVHDALQQRFTVLTKGWSHAAGRHRTLHAALDWSYSLLGADEQRLLRACGVFAGGFSLDLLVDTAADAAQDRWDLIDTLARLVDRSLVSTDAAEPPRYRLLETVRAYALGRLAEAGEDARLRRRLALALHALFVPAISAAQRRDAALAEYDNARESMAWATANDPALAVTLAVAICRVTTFTSWRREASAWLEACATLVEDPRVDAAERAQWWAERARQHVMNRDPKAREFGRRALELQRALGDEAGMFAAIIAMVRGSHEPDAELAGLCAQLEDLAARHPEWPPTTPLKLAGALAHACVLRDDREGQLAQRLREYELATRGGWSLLADTAETNISAALLRLGRHDEALERACALLARLGEQVSINVAYGWYCRVTALVMMQRWPEARAAMPQALAMLRRFDLPMLTEVAALMAARDGRPHAAALLIGYTRASFTAAARALDPDDLEQLAAAEAAARARMDAATFDRLVARGRALDAATADRIAAADDDVAT